ncbi:hypothetical protein N9F20_04495 [Candidatus Pelagibacter sp.]|jgi:D-glycero-alpha-D-manno-heptose-7-phosphate kinase|nr:hypothetical protein [Candidatus Pelagibacter sp.]|tara:strand:+ start:5458 stop:6438 length:981 start_codon:yes stop_codon:yes gene_type:complete
MIITRAPLRITLGGGGTDLPVWYKENKSFLTFMSINKYIYTSISERNYDKKIWLSYSKIECVKKISQIQNEYIKTCFNRFNFKRGIEFHSIAEIPSQSGLGSSGSFLVATNLGLNEYFNIKMSKQELAELSCKQEMNYLNKSTGKQDQYASTFGGLQSMTIDNSGKVKLKPLNKNKTDLLKFKNNILLYYTNFFRSSEVVLRSQKKNISKDPLIQTYMSQIQDIGYKSYEAIINNEFDEFGRLLDVHYDLKKKTSNLMSNRSLDKIYDYAKKIGAIGGKIIGAGGGGIFMFYVPKNKQKKFKEKIVKTKMDQINWDIDNSGACRIF